MDNRTDNIRRLIGKFYDGTTTVAEEELLAEFFRTAKDLPEDMEADRRVFRSLHGGAEAFRMPDSLGHSILDAVESRAASEKAAETTDAEKAREAAHGAFAGRSRGSIRRWIIPVISAAAVAAILLVIPFGRKMKTSPDLSEELASVETVTKDTTAGATLASDESAAPGVPEETPDRQTPVSESLAEAGHKPSTVVPKTSAPESETVVLSDEEKEALLLALSTLSKAGKEMAAANEKLESTDATVQNSISKISNLKIL